MTEGDATLAIRGLAAHDPEAEMWGELPNKSTDDKLEQEFIMTMPQWIAKHAKMGEYANIYTPYAYRMSDICSLQAALGVPGARIAGLMGAVIEEDYYLSLGGGPEGLDAAMEIWFKKKLDVANQKELFGGLRRAVNPDILTREVRTALAKGGLINREKIDYWTPDEAIVHFLWMVGKGMTTTNSPNAAVSIETKLTGLAEMAGTKDFPVELRSNVLVKLASFAGRKLSQVVGKKPENADYIPLAFNEDEEREIAEMVIEDIES